MTSKEEKFTNRFDEQVIQFSEKYGLNYEDVNAFAEWILWFCFQEKARRIKELIK